MGNYPAAKRKGQTEALEYEERERLFDRGLDRAKMNSLIGRLQMHFGSRNRLAEAVYGRKLAASGIKKLLDGGTRYTDTVIDRVVALAKEHGLPLTADEPVVKNDRIQAVTTDVLANIAANDAQQTDVPPVREDTSSTSESSAKNDDSEEPHASEHGDVTDVPSKPETAEADANPIAAATEEAQERHADASDWLSGVRERRADFAARVAEHDEIIGEHRARIAAIEEEIATVAAHRQAAANAMGEIDNALAILQTI